MTAPSSIRAARPPSSTASANGRGTDTDSPKAKPVAKKSKKKKMIIIIAGLLLIVGAGYYFVMPAKSGPAGPPKPGPVVALDATTLNLTDGHFLKLKLGLQTIEGKGATLDTSAAADITISEFSNRPMTSLVTDQQREAIKADLLKKLEAAYPGELMGVYFTEFVMQ